MLYRLLIAALLLLPIAANSQNLDFEAIVDSLDAIGPDLSRQAGVDSLVLNRGGVQFILEDGLLTFSEKLGGRTVAAAFKGEGRFKMLPPNRAERYMFAKLCTDTLADWEFSKAAFFFTDSTENELLDKLTFAPAGEKSGAEGLISDFMHYIEDEFKESFAAKIVPDLVQPALPGRFLAYFKSDCGKMVFVYDSKEIEEIQLTKHSRTAAGFYPELISSFHSADQYAESEWGPDHENKDLIDSLDYRISCKIWQSAKIDVDVQLSFLPLVDSLRAVTFTIFDGLDLESIVVLDAAGDTLYWDKLKEESAITVYLSEPLALHERSALRFKYSSGEVLRKTSWGNVYLAAPTTWYPRYGYLKRARYHLTFSCPEQYTFLSVGTKVSEKIEEGFKTTEWDLSEIPSSVVSFNYGLFERDSTSLTDGTPIEVYGGRSHGAFSGKMREGVKLDLAAAGALFSLELADYPFNKMWATEIPANHGQACPGFLHLAWGSFEVQRAGYTDAFVAHELAHQWWGHVVGWETYHDQWLSEGFAEYMAAWYVERKYKDDPRYKDRFFELVDNWRDDVLQSGSFQKWGGTSSYQEGNDAGPIWMGYRLASSKSSDYFTLVYSKGAYVLYMLRMLMHDFVKNDDSRFLDMLRDFVASYYWKSASTADFIDIAEKHYGGDLDWFFDQYVYDTQIPHYKWKASYDEQLDGSYLVSLDIKTEDVGDGFQMLVPVTIIMEGDYHATVRIRIDRLNQKVTLPKIPYKPRKIVFNTYKSVLCKDSEM